MESVSRVNLSGIESAHRLASARLYSEEAQHEYLRRFDLMQLNVYHVLQQDYFGSSGNVVANAEQLLRRSLMNSTATFDQAAAHAQAKLRQAGIAGLGLDGTVPLQVKAKIFSVYGRHYLELIGKLDILILTLRAMGGHDLLTGEEIVQQTGHLKREAQQPANLARDLRTACAEIVFMATGTRPGGTCDPSQLSKAAQRRLAALVQSLRAGSSAGFNEPEK